MSDINIRKKDGGYSAFDGEREIGECVYSEMGDAWNIYHTEISDEYGGQGIPWQMVKKVADDARQAGVKLRCSCSYAEYALQKHEEYNDILIKSDVQAAGEYCGIRPPQK